MGCGSLLAVCPGDLVYDIERIVYESPLGRPLVIFSHNTTNRNTCGHAIDTLFIELSVIGGMHGIVKAPTKLGYISKLFRITCLGMGALAKLD